MKLSVYKCGTKLLVNDSEFIGTIVAIYIKNELVQYEVGYFNKGEYMIALLNEDQFELKHGKNKSSIGYK